MSRDQPPGLPRRTLLRAAGAGLAIAGAAGGGAVAARAGERDQGGADPVLPFSGDVQAGISTPAQDRLHFAAFDVTTTDRAQLVELLREWSAAAQQLTRGDLVGRSSDEPLAPPDDTGEALGLGPSRLTITIGLGPGVFDDRFGLSARRPAGFAPLPALPGDVLDPARTGGDLCVQACADDPQVAFHAVRNLTRLARGAAVLRWSQLGFGRTSSTSRTQATPRNLMGFKDGTANIKLQDAQALREHVWVGGDRPGEPAWLWRGTYMVTRRIRMLVEAWDRAPLADQEQTFGRTKVSGAALGQRGEFDTVQLAQLPANSHVRLAHPSTNDGTQLLRRGYSFTDGVDVERGQLDAGLFFISFQRHPDAFVRVQRRLGANDRLNEYIEHNGSGVFVVPPGASAGGWVGETLFA